MQNMKVSKADLKMVQALALRFASELDDMSDEINSAVMGNEDAQELMSIMQSQINLLGVETLPAFQKELDNAFKMYVATPA